MAYIPPGALVAGSPPNALPRRFDRELPGEQVMLKGYWIDKFAYPNEEGAIPLTGVSQTEAQELCQKADKRLCTELEWERACKGPLNHRYAWGDRYRADACQLGSVILARPTGMKVGCHSDFDVFDLHGEVLEWTSSPWRRGAPSDLVVLKGGNGLDGELVGRCANAEFAAPSQRSSTIGFRCCTGPINTAEVIIANQSAEPLERLTSVDLAQFKRLLTNLSADDERNLPNTPLLPERAYRWHPVNNEQLHLFVACTRSTPSRHCGILAGRDTPGKPTGLGFADTGVLASSLNQNTNADEIVLVGLDGQGKFQRLVRYQAGLVFVGAKERQLPKAKKTKSKRHAAHHKRP
jgi:hypothetical protein